jgi:hypothetical protein
MENHIPENHIPESSPVAEFMCYYLQKLYHKIDDAHEVLINKVIESLSKNVVKTAEENPAVAHQAEEVQRAIATVEHEAVKKNSPETPHINQHQHSPPRQRSPPPGTNSSPHHQHSPPRKRSPPPGANSPPHTNHSLAAETVLSTLIISIGTLWYNLTKKSSETAKAIEKVILKTTTAPPRMMFYDQPFSKDVNTPKAAPPRIMFYNDQPLPFSKAVNIAFVAISNALPFRLAPGRGVRFVQDAPPLMLSMAPHIEPGALMLQRQIESTYVPLRRLNNPELFIVVILVCILAYFSAGHIKKVLERLFHKVMALCKTVAALRNRVRRSIQLAHKTLSNFRAKAYSSLGNARRKIASWKKPINNARFKRRNAMAQAKWLANIQVNNTNKTRLFALLKPSEQAALLMHLAPNLKKKLAADANARFTKMNTAARAKWLENVQNKARWIRLLPPQERAVFRAPPTPKRIPQNARAPSTAPAKRQRRQQPNTGV